MKPRDSHRVPLREHGCLTADALLSAAQSGSEPLDLSGSGNPYAAPQPMLDALQRAPFQHYPESTAARARAALAQSFGIPPERVVLGNGASELIWSAARMLVRHDDTVLVVMPSYAELPAALRQIGARVVQWRSVERTGHRVDLEQLRELMAIERPTTVCLCAPGTPTGSSVPFAELSRLATSFPEVAFLVDQSLLALSDDHVELALMPHDNVVCIRSLGKTFGLPGARAGYLIASTQLATRIEESRPAFSTNAAAQAVALHSVDHEAFVAASRERLRADRDRLSFVLHKLGLHATPSVAPFLLVRLARASELTLELWQAHGIAVCDASSFGLPDHVRIASLPEHAERRFEQALRTVTTRRGLTRGRDA